jgi:hypothetical protein
MIFREQATQAQTARGLAIAEMMNDFSRAPLSFYWLRVEFVLGKAGERLCDFVGAGFVLID